MKYALAKLSLCLGALICVLAGSLAAQSRPVDSGLTAHEWGTFTSIAGNNGQAVEWLPLTGSTDLPSFVEHFRHAAFKVGLSGTIRMETPVLYFYSTHDVTLSVHVNFAKGLITEWYPHANAPAVETPYYDSGLYDGKTKGTISWDSVNLEPGRGANFPRDTVDNDNHYYAARETSATPLRVRTAGGDQHEKFLFYRGVSAFPVPVSACFTADGKVVVRNRLKQEIPSIILFERRGDKVGYRISDALQSEAAVEPPELTATVESLYGDLEEILVTRGLYRDEAHAMLETWRNTWFEEGSRLFYILPAEFVDGILPLTITPRPAQTVRVFVGRLELVSPATQKAVAAALASKDQTTLAKYGRFLGTILQIIEEKNSASTQQFHKPLDVPCESKEAGVARQQR
jgi:hypothetical protein